MKISRQFYFVLAAVVGLGGAMIWQSNGATTASASTPRAKAKPANGATNSATATNTTLPIPESVFNVTLTPTKNPFFPLSLKRPVADKTAPVAPSVSASAFKLMGLSGSSTERLAMINGKTMAAGETRDFTLSSGAKATVRLLQVKEDSVIIRVVTPPQPDLIELSLFDGKKDRVYMGAAENPHSPK